jgi:hypothetical protein
MKITLAADGRQLVVALGQDQRPVDQNGDFIGIAGGAFEVVAEVPLQDEVYSSSCLTVSADSNCAYFVTCPPQVAPLRTGRGLDPAANAATRRLPLPGSDLRSVAVSNKAGRISVSEVVHKGVHLVDRYSFQLVSSFGLEGHTPEPLSLDDPADLLAVFCPATNRLFFVDPHEGTVVGRVDGLRKGMYKLELATTKGIAVSGSGGVGEIAVVDLHRVPLAAAPGSVDKTRGRWQLTGNHGNNTGPDVCYWLGCIGNREIHADKRSTSEYALSFAPRNNVPWQSRRRESGGEGNGLHWRMGPGF